MKFSLLPVSPLCHLSGLEDSYNCSETDHMGGPRVFPPTTPEQELVLLSVPLCLLLPDRDPLLCFSLPASRAGSHTHLTKLGKEPPTGIIEQSLGET